MAYQFVGTMMNAIYVPARTSKKGESIEESWKIQLSYEHSYVEGADPELKIIPLKVTQEVYNLCKSRKGEQIVCPVEFMVGDKGNLVVFYPKNSGLPRFAKSSAVEK